MTAQTTELALEVRAFLQSEILPLEPIFLKHGFKAVLPALKNVRQKVKAKGWWLPPYLRPMAWA
jgi:acyl-CoA dehydrogenase